MKSLDSRNLVSVIIPIYNGQDYLRRCFDSLLAQDDTDWEAWLVDDGSTDRSAELCREQCAADARFHLIRQANGGMSRARNAALDQAQGKYLLYLDCDDALSPHMLGRLRRALEETGSDFAECPKLVLKADEAYQEAPAGEQKIFTSQLEIFRSALYGEPLSYFVTGKLFARDLVQDLRFPEGISIEDACYAQQLLLRSRRAVFVDDVAYIYYSREGSVMHAPFDRYRDYDYLRVHSSNARDVAERYPELGNLARQREVRSYLYYLDRQLSAPAAETGSNPHPRQRRDLLPPELAAMDEQELLAWSRAQVLRRWRAVLGGAYFSPKRKLALLLLALSLGLYRRALGFK